MPYISSASHQKFLQQCRILLPGDVDHEVNPGKDQLRADLERLEQMAETYSAMMAKLPVLARDYNILQKRIRVNARKLKLKTV